MLGWVLRIEDDIIFQLDPTPIPGMLNMKIMNEMMIGTHW